MFNVETNYDREDHGCYYIDKEHGFNVVNSNKQVIKWFPDYGAAVNYAEHLNIRRKAGDYTK
jgi:hypothetical protein